MCTSAGGAVNVWGWVCTAGVGLHICTGPCLCAAWGTDDVRGYACALSAPQATRCSRAAGKVAAEPAPSLSPQAAGCPHWHCSAPSSSSCLLGQAGPPKTCTGHPVWGFPAGTPCPQHAPRAAVTCPHPGAPCARPHSAHTVLHERQSRAAGSGHYSNTNFSSSLAFNTLSKSSRLVSARCWFPDPQDVPLT